MCTNFELTCIVLFFIIIYVFIVNDKKAKRNKRKMSFKESMDLAELPIVTFYQGDKKFNFLLDSGSNYSHISAIAAKNIQGTKINVESDITGIGQGKSEGMYKAVLTYKNLSFDIDLCITKHLNDSFSSIKKETGIQIHGIIGNQFLQKYKYVLDFNELVAYPKK